MEKTDYNKRVEWIDSVKGIGIILVVIGHHLLGVESVANWISCFHMPLFFMVTGYLSAYKQEWELPLKRIFVKKAKALLYPYFTLSVIVLVWHFLFYLVFSNSTPEMTNSEIILLTISTYGYHALWFLPCLCFGSILFLLLRKYRIHHIVCIICSLFVILQKSFLIDLPTR